MNLEKFPEPNFLSTYLEIEYGYAKLETYRNTTRYLCMFGSTKMFLFNNIADLSEEKSRSFGITKDCKVT